MGKQERTFDCANCGATVIVEFGTYVGGPLAYDDYAKCKNCDQEYTDQAEIDKLVATKRALNKKNLHR
jgi:transcription elongation factor Elf1